jgi:hypothetical protein
VRVEVRVQLSRLRRGEAGLRVIHVAAGDREHRVDDVVGYGAQVP